MRNQKLLLLSIVTTAMSHAWLPALPGAAQSEGRGEPGTAEESAQRAPLVGRVETIEAGGEPRLPSDILRGGADEGGGFQLRSQAEQSETLPTELTGEWDGSVKITQLATYPDLHPEPYCQQFIQEINHFFKLGKGGQIALKFKTGSDGRVTVDSSDVWFAGGLKVQLANNSGPALVPGGTNVPSVVKNTVTPLAPGRVEQTKVDYVRIVGRMGRLIHDGFTEVTAVYQLVPPRRMKLRILNIDYDSDGKPLWKTLMEGEARRWSRK